MKKKRIRLILGILAAGIICGGWYAYHEFTRKVKDLAYVKAGVRLNGGELVQAYELDEQGSNTRFLDKIIAVTGTIKAIERSGDQHLTVVLGTAGDLSAVRCSMDPAHQQELTGLTAGKTVTLKGACTGFNADALLGSDVLLNRCVLEN